MSACIIDGKAIAADIRAEIKAEVGKMDLQPGLATVLVGEDPASQFYVRMKHRACEEVGIHSEGVVLPKDATQETVEAEVERLAQDPKIHGILVQLPLPKHLDEDAVLSRVPLEKDVDGFHPLNIGLLAQRGREPHFVPCTPAGCIELLERSGIAIRGAKAVVVGRSNIVGLPVSLLLIERDATVTIVHSKTKDMGAELRQADIVIAAMGRAEAIDSSMLKPGCAVIDVGINRVDDSEQPRGYRLAGDVDFRSAEPVAGWLTPVPGGVGPMTIAMLLKNTLKAAKK